MIRITLADNRQYQLAFNHNYIEVPVDVSEDGWTYTYQRMPVAGSARLFATDEPEYVFEGNYYVHPADNPDKAVGRRIALDKLTKQLSQEDARAVWEAYRSSGAAIR